MTGEVVTVEDWAKPRPQPDRVSHEYWEACARGELMVQECADCGTRQFYPRAICTACGGEPRWLTTTGRGIVHTFTIIRQYGMPPFRDELPYVVAMVELPEGPLIMGNVTDCDPEAVHVGMPVEVHFARIDEEVGIPFWRPAAS